VGLARAKKEHAMLEHVHEDRDTTARQPNLDPVCGMTVSESSPHRHLVGAVEYRFCSAHCLERFAKRPEAFLARPDGR
jgi:Cu+-exporting ATPase